MKQSMRNKLEKLSFRLNEINSSLICESSIQNIDEFRKLTCEQAELSSIIKHYQAWSDAYQDEIEAKKMLTEVNMKSFAEEEIGIAQKRMFVLEKQLQKMLLPKDIDDERNIFLEIRAGTGGEESALFAADLLRMYLRYVERQRWNVEIISESIAARGGYKEVILRILGHGAYSKLKFESGGHRVQRVPITETQGRIHTSTCTVAVMPEANEISEIKLNPTDLRIDTFRASGAGGQHINKTDSAVRITHLPTGIVVECQDDRSQHKNKDRALKVLAARIKDKQARDRRLKEATDRRNLIGSGDRSERIRTYNFPQGRVTDHRINLTLYQLEELLAGDLDELISVLRIEYQSDQIQALDEKE